MVDNNDNDDDAVVVAQQSKSIRKTKHSLMESNRTASENNLEQQSTARKRWKLLAKWLHKDPEEEFNATSIRRFKTFNLLHRYSLEFQFGFNTIGDAANWFQYKFQNSEYCVNIHHMNAVFNPNDLVGFNNTGNICVWPAEEALTAFVLADLAAYQNKWILELGGGFTCITGLILAKYGNAYLVHLTDGNEVCVQNIKTNLCLNEVTCYTKVSSLKWEDVNMRIPGEKGQFDIILAADCLFFDDSRAALVDTIWFYLSTQGVALVMAPRRHETMSVFMEECVAKGFSVETKQRYNETIWKRHLELKKTELYDENIHYPVLILLTKSKNDTKSVHLNTI